MRLRGWDYSQAAVYFVTICTYQRECLLGEVVDGRVRTNAYGRIVEEERRTREIRPEVELDAFMVMPNHLHGIVVVPGRGARPRLRQDLRPCAPTTGHLFRRPRSLGSLVAGFKSASTRRINAVRGAAGSAVWQRNYHDRIVRNKRELRAIRQYIRQNPAHWPDDPENLSQLVQG